MCNPLSPLLSEIFVKKIAERIEKEGIIPPFWVRYVGDVLVVGKRQGVTSMLASLNNIHEKIAFTMEMEVEHSLPF